MLAGNRVALFADDILIYEDEWPLWADGVATALRTMKMADFLIPANIEEKHAFTSNELIAVVQGFFRETV